MDTNSSRKNVVRPGPATGKYVQGACKVVLRWADSSGFAVQSYNHKSGVWRGMVPEKSTGAGRRREREGGERGGASTWGGGSCGGGEGTDGGVGGGRGGDSERGLGWLGSW